MPAYFSFSLRPVQAFIHQARRTRDFWAGSQLLAWLCATAVVATRAQDPKAQFEYPLYDDDFIISLGLGAAPSYPVSNRFSALVRDDFDGAAVRQAVHRAWEALTERVWHLAIGSPSHWPLARAVWDRQINGFLRIGWVVGDRVDLLDALHAAEMDGYGIEEPGLNCSLMPGWQEVSGVPHRIGVARLTEERREFWRHVHDRTGYALEGEGDEYLCAMALVKRLLNRCLPGIKVPLNAGVTMLGWPALAQVPSLYAIAAGPWIARVLRDAEDGPLKRFVEDWSRASAGYSAVDLFGPSVAQGWRDRGCTAARLDCAALYGRDDDVGGDLAADTNQLPGSMHALECGKPSRYFAVLRMDVDDLGGTNGALSRAVQDFVAEVAETIREHGGLLVYAGGDDLVALLPVATALRAVASLSSTFSLTCSPLTLSAALSFAHVKTPFATLLRDTQTLLDDYAKRRMRKDALVISLEQRTTTGARWLGRWESAMVPDAAELELQAVGRALDDPGCAASNRFLARLPRLLTGFDLRASKDDDEHFPRIVDVVTAMALRSAAEEDRAFDPVLTRSALERALRFCWPFEVTVGRSVERADSFAPDGLVLLRFLRREAGLA